MKELLENHPLCLFVLLPSLPEPGALKKLNLLQAQIPWFDSLNIHLEFALDCSKEDQLTLQNSFPHPVAVSDLSLHRAAVKYGCMRTKPVFGQMQSYCSPSLILFDHDRILDQTYRINPDATEHILQTALKCQTLYLRHLLENTFDTEQATLL